MAASLLFSSNVFSSIESPSAGHMGRQTPPVGWITRSRNVRFRRCFKVRAMQASAGADEVISAPGHMQSKNLYKILEINPAATAKDIKRAYRKLAREFHPDQATSPEAKNESTQMFLRIHNAYVTLSDPHDRAQYDRQLLGQVRGFAGQTWSKATNGQAPAYRYCGHVGRSWETDQCG
jgi:hypothetical protein